MAGERVMPGGLGIEAGWTVGSDGWAADMDTNLRIISALLPGRAKAFSVLPVSPADGDIYVVSTAGANVNKIAVRDLGVWYYIVPLTGMELYLETPGARWRFNGTTWVTTVIAQRGGRPDARLEDRKSSGTPGGTTFANSWQTRDLNTEVFDPDNLISLASNVFTVAVDGYVAWSCPKATAGVGQTALRNQTDDVPVAYGTTEWANSGVVTRSFGGAKVQAGKSYFLQHRVNANSANTGFGVATGFDSYELYSFLDFWRD